MEEVLNKAFVASGPLQWLMVFVLALALAILVKLALRFAESRLSAWVARTKSRLDDMFVDCLSSTRTWVLFIWFLNPLVQVIKDDSALRKPIVALAIIATAFQVIVWGLNIIRDFKVDYLARRVQQDASAISAFNLISTAIKGFFVVAVVLICMSNLGVDIGALLAGLGIGGVAVALAAQNILGDLFGSLSIVLDKPFEVGDYIVVGQDQGTVEYIGLKTTRVRSLSGEELVFANKDLLESRVKNFKRMRERRAVLSFGVPHSTDMVKLHEIPRWIQAFIEGHKLLRYERSHMMAIDKSSLNFETVFWVQDPDYMKYMDLQEELLHEIILKFAEESVHFALPAQVMTIEKIPELKSQFVTIPNKPATIGNA